MKFKYRYLDLNDSLIVDYFDAETIEEALEKIDIIEKNLDTPIRVYEMESKKRIKGGKLE